MMLREKQLEENSIHRVEKKLFTNILSIKFLVKVQELDFKSMPNLSTGKASFKVVYTTLSRKYYGCHYAA